MHPELLRANPVQAKGAPPSAWRCSAASRSIRSITPRSFRKYLGDTAKHIVACFQRARELGAVLFFDEADSLLSRRVAIGESIVTTNLFGNYDPALLRRVNRHIEFKLPSQAMRRKIIDLHLR